MSPHTACGAQGGGPVDSQPIRRFNEDFYFAARLSATVRDSHYFEQSLRAVWVYDEPIDEPSSCAGCPGECGQLYCYGSGPSSK
jgi:hypothetical protein